MRKATVAWAYKRGYESAKAGEAASTNPYDGSQSSSKYAWIGGFNDYLSGHELDLDILKEEIEK